MILILSLSFCFKGYTYAPATGAIILNNRTELTEKQYHKEGKRFILLETRSWDNFTYFRIYDKKMKEIYFLEHNYITNKKVIKNCRDLNFDFIMEDLFPYGKKDGQ